jgi:hypothetical protein
MHHIMTDLKFGSCTVLSSSSPVIEASKFATVEVESRSQTPSLLLRCLHRCGLYTVYILYIDDLYNMHHYNYAATGDVVKCFIITHVLNIVYSYRVHYSTSLLFVLFRKLIWGMNDCSNS